MNENENLTVVEPGVDYIGMINDLKANTVSKEQYDKLKADHLKAMDTIINGGSVEVEQPKVVDKDALRRDLYGDNGFQGMSLDYIIKTLELRDAVIEEFAAKGKDYDPATPQGKQITATPEDKASAERVAAGFRHCIEVADGDPQVFVNELQRITVNTPPIRRAK